MFGAPWPGPSDRRETFDRPDLSGGGRVAGHGRVKYATGTRLGTSRGRGWNGLLAERWRHAEGDLGEVASRDTEVIIMLQGCIRVRRRGDGRVQHHDATPGSVWLCPAGVHEDMIHLYGEAEESLHLYPPPSPLSVTALRELDVDPDKVGLRYDGGFHDVTIEDDARGFDPLAAPLPNLDTAIEHRPVGGLGVHFVRTAMDRVAYERRDDRNILTNEERHAGQVPSYVRPLDAALVGRGPVWFS